MPDTPSLAEKTYEIFIYETNGELADTLYLDIDGFSNSIELPEGTYDLEVLAYLYPERPVAKDFIIGVVINEGGKTVCDIVLKPIITDPDGKQLEGTFIWDIQFIDLDPADTEDITVMLTIDLLDPETFELSGELIFYDYIDFNDSMDLPIGYYNVHLVINKPDTNPIIINEVLYVYCNLESIFELELTSAFFMGNVYTVTFILGYAGPNEPEPAAVSHGNARSLNLPGNINRTGYIFDGWWTKDGSEDEDWGIRWEDSNYSRLNNIIFRNFNLYAKWIPQVLSVGISAPSTYNFPAIKYGIEPQPQPYSVVVTNTGNSPTGNLTIALSGANAGNFRLSPDSTINSIAVGASANFTVAVMNNLTPATYTATVTVSGNGIPSRSFNVNFTVNPPDVAANRITTLSGNGTDNFLSVISVPDGIVAAGYSLAESFNSGDWAGVIGRGGTDAVIAKYNNNGGLIWKKHFGGNGTDRFDSVTEIRNVPGVADGYIAVGHSQAASFGNGDWGNINGLQSVTSKSTGEHAIIVKYDVNGNVVWRRNFNGGAAVSSRFYSVITVTDGIIAVGYSGHEATGTQDWSGFNGRGGWDAVIVKYNFDGNVNWKNRVGGSGDDQFQAVAEVSGDIIAVGYSEALSFTGQNAWTGVTGRGNADAIIVRFAGNNGELQWVKNFGGSGNDIFASVITVSDGIIAAGFSGSFGNGDWAGITGKGSDDAIIVKYDFIGNVLWKNHFGGNASDMFTSVTGVLGGYIAVGYSQVDSFNNGDWSGVTGRGLVDAIMVRYDTNGNLIWKRHFGGNNDDYFNSITTVPGGFITAGYSMQSSFNSGDYAAFGQNFTVFNSATAVTIRFVEQ